MQPLSEHRCDARPPHRPNRVISHLRERRARFGTLSRVVGSSFRELPTRRAAIVVCGLCALATLACACLLMAAVLVPAPAAVVPFVVAVSIGLPMLTALEVPAAVAVLRSGRRPPTTAAPLDRRA